MLDEIIGNVQDVFFDPVNGGIALVIALIAGFLMGRYSSIVYFCIASALAYALALFIKAVALDGTEPLPLAEAWWNGFLGMNAGEVLAYLLAFAVVITLVFLAKSLILRR